jgi:hypothetical protein
MFLQFFYYEKFLLAQRAVQNKVTGVLAFVDRQRQLRGLFFFADVAFWQRLRRAGVC